MWVLMIRHCLQTQLSPGACCFLAQQIVCIPLSQLAQVDPAAARAGTSAKSKREGRSEILARDNVQVPNVLEHPGTTNLCCQAHAARRGVAQYC